MAFCLAASTTPASAQGDEPSRSGAVQMRDTAIFGERPTPDIFFIVPTGRSGNLRTPHRRDYSGEILEPVVKPWLEKDQNVTLAGITHVSTGAGDWREAFDAAPITPPIPAAVRPAARPTVEIPAAALSRPADAAAAPPPTPSQARPAAPPPSFPPPAAVVPRPSPPPPASSPPPSYGGSPGDVPILVPPQ